ncbi:MAG: NADPH:quinone reductase-like Zn-dependent oxidoreductase [Paraglaciecola psychrophila]
MLHKITIVLLLTTGYLQAEGYQKIIIDEHGAANVMRLVDKAGIPEPGIGEVRVKVLAAGVSFTDTMVRKGLYAGLDAEVPFTPGYDLVGVIDKL